jgi:hypothetical protein
VDIKQRQLIASVILVRALGGSWDRNPPDAPAFAQQ